MKRGRWRILAGMAVVAGTGWGLGAGVDGGRGSRAEAVGRPGAWDAPDPGPAERVASRDRAGGGDRGRPYRDSMAPHARAGERRGARAPAADRKTNAERAPSERAFPRVYPIELEALSVDGAPRMARVAGFDPGAPRTLELHRRRGRDAGLLARGESGPDGRLHFPPLLVPGDGFEVVVVPAGERLDGPFASETRHVPPRRPRAPRALLLAASDGGVEIRVVPAEATGAVLLASPDGEVFARHALEHQLDDERRNLDLFVTPASGDTSLLLAHELPDGRRSEWRPFPLPGAEPGPDEIHTHPGKGDDRDA